jgi:uncharacterized protein YcaQ
LELSLSEARRAAVSAQLLSAPRPTDIVKVVEQLGSLQLDPTSAVARSEHIVLWSRIGSYDLSDLDLAMYRERRLFEYGSWILPISEFELHRDAMRRYLEGPTTRQRYVRSWLHSNAAFHRSIVAEIRNRGPLRSRDLVDQAVVPWRTGGWNDGKNVGRMLDSLWKVGVLAIVGRDGSERIWDLAERSYPRSVSKLRAGEAAFRRMAMQLRARGIARVDQFGFGPEGRLPRWKQTLRELERRRTAKQAHVKGLAGDWFVYMGALERRTFRPRTTLLSPFDQLISNRERAEELFGFRFKLELYIPPAKREFGYYVMPILSGERLIGRVDPVFDRKSGVFRVNAVYAEPDAPPLAATGVARAIRDLARWVGAKRIDIIRSRSPWEEELRRLV